MKINWNVSSDVVIMTKDELNDLLLNEFQKGVKRGEFESKSIQKRKKEYTELIERIESKCEGYPYAKIYWPHRLLHEIIEVLEQKQKDTEQ